MEGKTTLTLSIFVFCIFVFSLLESSGNTTYPINGSVDGQMISVTDTNAVFIQALESLSLSKKENNETSLINAHLNLARFHDQYGQLDSAIYYYQELKDIYKNAGLTKAVAETCLELKGLYGSKAAYAESLEQVYEALELYEAMDKQKGIALCYTHICDLLYYEDKYQESANYCDKAIAIQEEIDAKNDLAVSLRYKASSQLFIEGALEDALKTVNQSIEVYNELGETGLPLMASINGRGNILKYLERYDEAIADYQYIYDKTIEMGLEQYAIPPIANIGHVYLIQEKYEKALPYHLEAIDRMKQTGNSKNLWENYSHVSNIYNELEDYKKAYEYSKLESIEREKYLNSIIDRLESEAQIKYETAKKDEMINQQEDKIAYQKRTQILYLSIAVLLVASLLGMIRSRIKIRKKQTEIEQSRIELQKSLENLKTTQTQLIHAEKMASLGELTAGIAHEIQNPLNFVNNFAEVSIDLMDEMNEELETGNTEEVTAIAGDLKQNLEKINHHGKRADAIVKGMLQHSRSSSGVKEPTDINALADEYLRLCYHGLRAKDKSFNSTIKTDFDDSIGKVNIIPQDIGKVILNLLTNAFYAVNEKKILNIEGYEPVVSLNTKRLDGKMEIKVGDNGNGIPQKVLDKIFQPFFTTKPTGEGTGLGLSLSYDIVTKGHGGSLDVETKSGTGTNFTILIPINP